jgi:hypothetical protein
MLREHRLTQLGVVRELQIPGRVVALQRDMGWRAGRAPLVAFTDDDCRPPADWLERALQAAELHPGAIIQGRTVPDPEEVEILQRSPHPRTQDIVPPSVWAQTCNIVYPRSVLESVGGFDLGTPASVGDDTDLALRAIANGVGYEAAPEMVTYHAVHDGTLVDRIRSGWRWGDLPYLIKRHPELRRQLPARYFWKPTHAWMAPALAVLLTRGPRAGLVAALPWAVASWPQYSGNFRGRVRGVSELPGHALIDLVEMAALARGSIRHRTLLL